MLDRVWIAAQIAAIRALAIDLGPLQRLNSATQSKLVLRWAAGWDPGGKKHPMVGGVLACLKNPSPGSFCRAIEVYPKVSVGSQLWKTT